jgi:hypothetical protein
MQTNNTNGPNASVPRDVLNELLLQSWNEFDRLNECRAVVRPAIPILFFGDSNRYFTSTLKIITVGLNPSCAEFPDGDRFSRFSNIRDLTVNQRRPNNMEHLSALHSYFHCNPYSRWFASFQPVLNGANCSFYDDLENSALHTDLCSPIATSPTWSKLSKDSRASFLAGGVTLWHSLIEALAPDVVLMSIKREYLDLIQFKRGRMQVIWKLERERPYEVWVTPIQIRQTKLSLLVFGRAAQTPFGLISNDCKKQVGRIILEEVFNLKKKRQNSV